MMKKYQDKEWLYRKYIVEGLSIQKIAILCQVSYITIWKWLNKFDIQRRSISEANKGRILSEEHRKNIGFAKKGKKLPPFTEEHLKNMSIAFTGRKYSKKHNKKISKRMKGNQIWLGKHHTKESIKKMSESKKGDKHPNWGKHHSKETIKIMKEAAKGRKCLIAGWNKGIYKTRIKIRCAHCNNEFWGYEGYRFCSRECYSKFPKTEETKMKMANYGEDNGMYGRTHTKKVKEMQSEKMKIYYQNSENRKKVSERHKKLWQNLKYRERILKSHEVSNKRRPTNPEKVFDELTPEYVRYVGNGKWWRNRHNPDFKITGQNKVIEIYGDYWHRNDDPKDRIREYKEMGLNCLVFWEHEVYEEPERLLEEVNEFIKV